MMRHEYQYCRAVEIPLRKDITSHDTFIDGNTLNHEEIEDFSVPVAEYAINLAKTACKPSVELVAAPEPSNLVDLSEYRDERNAPHAA